MSDGEHVWVDLPTVSSAGRRRVPGVTLAEEAWTSITGPEVVDDRGVLTARLMINSVPMTMWAIAIDLSLPSMLVPDEIVTMTIALLNTRPATGMIRGRRYLMVAVPTPTGQPGRSEPQAA